MAGIEREYAAALFMLAAEQDCVEAYRTALQTVKTAVDEQPSYVEFLRSPAVPLAERLAALDAAFASLPTQVVSLLKLLCENGHIRELSACIDEFEQLARWRAQRTTAVISSAVALDEQQKTAICRKLEAMTGKGIDPQYTVDASLIGGLVVEVDGSTYDGSIKHRLYEIKDVMIR